MSDRLKQTQNELTNEKIVEQITMDLKSSLLTEDKAQESVVNPGSSVEVNTGTSGDGIKQSDADRQAGGSPDDIPVIDCDADNDYEERDKDQSDTDSINEEYLKDAELDLTDDQKAERQLIAEEMKIAGNQAFKIEEYEKSIDKYTEGLRLCPLQYSQLRSILYCNRSAAKMKLQKYDKAIKDCTKAIELDDKYLKAYIRRAQSYESTEKFDESLADYKKILELDPSNKDAQTAQRRLPPLIEEKNEKLKTEMLGKLKDLGNMILKPFGLSTENFQMEQDPDTKGYKINFKQ